MSAAAAVTHTAVTCAGCGIKTTKYAAAKCAGCKIRRLQDKGCCHGQSLHEHLGHTSGALRTDRCNMRRLQDAQAAKRTGCVRVRVRVKRRDIHRL
jgi:hypothetical protein